MGQRNSIRSDLLPKYQQLNSLKELAFEISRQSCPTAALVSSVRRALTKVWGRRWTAFRIPEHSYSLECVSDSKRAILCHFAGRQIRQKIDAMRF